MLASAFHQSIRTIQTKCTYALTTCSLDKKRQLLLDIYIIAGQTHKAMCQLPLLNHSATARKDPR